MGPHLSVCHQRSPVVSGIGSSLLQGPVWSGPLHSGAPKQSSTRLVAPFNVGERGGPTARAASHWAFFSRWEGVGPGEALP